MFTLTSRFVEIQTKTESLLTKIQKSKAKLFSGLMSVEREIGWMDPIGESSLSIWTAIEVLNTLVKNDIFPRNYRKILTHINNSIISVDGFRGLEYDGFKGRVSVYLTGDLINLYISLRRYDEIHDYINTLQSIQNEDGGWGVCNGDVISKVRSTAWVLWILLSLLNNTFTENMIDLKVINRGIKWLYAAQNDHEQDCGWGNVPDSIPSNVTATVFALRTLLELISYCTKKTCDIPLKIDAINRGLQKLLDMSDQGGWRGSKEEFGIKIDGNSYGRHIIGGAATTLVLPVLIKACNHGLLNPYDEYLFLGLEDILNRCKKYPGLVGEWLIPGEDGGAPITWNSAFAIDALIEFEKYYLSTLAGTCVEKNLYNEIVKYYQFFQRGFFVLLIGVLSYFLYPYLTFANEFAKWFNNLSVLKQGIFMTFFAIAIEQILSRLVNFAKLEIAKNRYLISKKAKEIK